MNHDIYISPLVAGKRPRKKYPYFHTVESCPEPEISKIGNQNRYLLLHGAHDFCVVFK